MGCNLSSRRGLFPLVNVPMCQFTERISGANMKNAVVTEAYVSGATKMEPTNVEGAGERYSSFLFLTPAPFCLVVARVSRTL